MRYKVEALEAAVKYLSEHNKSFKGQDNYIRASIIQGMKEMVGRGLQDYGTMGFIVKRLTGSEHIHILVDLNVLHGSYNDCREV